MSCSSFQGRHEMRSSAEIKSAEDRYSCEGKSTVEEIVSKNVVRETVCGSKMMFTKL